jgi:hypothetical protein
MTAFFTYARRTTEKRRSVPPKAKMPEDLPPKKH